MKRKRKLKRFHAKNRALQPKVEREVVLPVEIKGDAENSETDHNEIKKKRNRMSAQISRDRKKEHIKDLERNYQQLKEETEQTKAENEKLKEQLKKFNESQASSPSKNKFLSLLMILGIIFLISLVKDLFKPNSYSLSLSPVETAKDSLLSAEEQTELIGKGKQLLSEMEDIEEEDLAVNKPEVKKAVFSKLK